MRKRIYTINVNVKDGKELVDEIKDAAKRAETSVSAYLIRCHVFAQEQLHQATKSNSTALPPQPTGGPASEQ